MGCVYSHRRDEAGDGNTDRLNLVSRSFHVVNVNDRGEEINSGDIEITDTDLILKQGGLMSVTWPLRLVNLTLTFVFMFSINQVICNTLQSYADPYVDTVSMPNCFPLNVAGGAIQDPVSTPFDVKKQNSCSIIYRKQLTSVHRIP